MNEEEYVGGKIFENVKIDDRVHPELRHCLYCTVMTHYESGGGIRNPEYKLPLEAIGKGYMWQCPACKRIYILKDEL